MWTLPTAARDALQDPTTQHSWLVWITARDRDTGDPVTRGFWDGPWNASVTVTDPFTGASVARTYTGTGAVLEVDGLEGSYDLSVKTATVRLSQVDDTVELHIRGDDVRQAPIEVHLALFVPGTNALVAIPVARFVGFVDGSTIETPAENSSGGVTLNCVSHSRELTRSNPDVRSHQSQQRRLAGDTAFKYVDVMGLLTLSWGKWGGPIKDGGKTKD